jgi:hypothetical protein
LETQRELGSRLADYRPTLCENFLYVFKAALRAARAATSAASPQLPLTLPLRRGQTPVGWREDQTLSGRQSVERSPAAQCDPSRPGRGRHPLRHCPGGPEPVKGAFGVGFAADP